VFQHLDQFEFCHLHLRLDLLSPVNLPAFATLRLRRDLRRTAVQVLGEGPAFSALFDPPVAGDAVSARRYQRPGPAFVLAFSSHQPAVLDAGEALDLDLRLFGQGIRYAAEFLACLEALGRSGLWRDDGRFAIGAVETVGPAGETQQLQGSGPGIGSNLPIISARWFLDSLPVATVWRLVLTTPARLLVAGRPLFRGDLQRIVPFILRRVTSVAHAHCGIDLIADPRLLLERCGNLVVHQGRLAWQDWRSLAGDDRSVDLGGLTGTVTFSTTEEDLLSLLHLGSLVGIGKGAAYGAGHFALELGSGRWPG